MSDQPRWPVVTGAVVGSGIATVGVLSLLEEAGDTHPAATLRWVLGLALAHDLLLMPAVFLIGTAVRRWVPAAFRPFAAGGLLVSGTLTLVAWPLVRGYGRAPANPSILPRDYDRGLLLALVATWLVTALAAVASRRGRRSA